MSSAAAVLVCALAVLGRSERSMPPIEFVDTGGPEVSVGAEAFIRPNTGTIVLITSSAVFQQAAAFKGTCEQSIAAKKLASILAHEEWHVRHGTDEKAAYEKQLITLITLGVSPGSALYRSVQLSMLRVLELRKRTRPDVLIARN